MPTVLITGLNGFVAVHVAHKFLQEGWSVRGTVRSAEKGDKVKALPVLAQAAKEGRVEYVVVEDLAEGDFSKALDGVDAIAHCASPWHLNGKSWAEYRDPAIKGTTNILEQAAKFDSVKSVSVVSSFAAIGDFSKPASEQEGTVYTENDWLPWKAEDMEGLKAEEGGAVQWYCASKKYAELAARDVPKKIGAKYTISTMCPPVILGPAIHYGPGTSAKELASSDVSTTDTYNAVASGKDGQVPGTPFPTYADVRNIADAIFVSLDKKIGGRFPLCNGLFDYQGLANRAKELYPDLAKADQIPQGKPDDLPSKKCYRLDGSKATKELGVQYKPLDETLRDIVDQFVALGAMKA